MKKVFLKIRSIFLPGSERYFSCIYCGKELIGSQRKFCSEKCNNDYWRKVYSGEIDQKTGVERDNFNSYLNSLSKKDLLRKLKGGLCKECKRKLHP